MDSQAQAVVTPGAWGWRRAVGLLLLLGGGVLGNYLALPLFQGFDYVFGTILVLITLALYGVGWGVVAALVAASYTLILWGHPYALVWYAGEAVFVGILLRRAKSRNLILFEAIYWPLVGAPLIWVMLHLVGGLDAPVTMAVILKQWVNGIGNALGASIVLALLPAPGRRAAERRTYELSHLLFTCLAGVAIAPAILVMALYGREVRRSVEGDIAGEVTTLSSEMVSDALDLLHRHTRMLQGMMQQLHVSPEGAEARLQAVGAVVRVAMPDVQALRLVDAQGRVLASYPAEESAAELSAELAALFRRARNTEHWTAGLAPLETPRGSERVAAPAGMLWLVMPGSPCPVGGRALLAALDQRAMQGTFSVLMGGSDVRAVLVDGESRVVAATASGPPVGSRYRSPPREVVPRPEYGLEQCYPDPEEGGPRIDRWRRSAFVCERMLGEGLGWRLLVEAPLAPQHVTVFRTFVVSFGITLVLMLLSVLFAHIASRRVSAPLAQLSAMTTAFSADPVPLDVVRWPRSAVREVDALVANFRELTGTLAEKFREIRGINENLEGKVRARTRELVEANDTLEALVAAAPLAIVITDRAGVVRLSNPAAEAIFDWLPAASGATPPRRILPPGLLELFGPVWGGEDFTDRKLGLQRRDGTVLDLSVSAAPLRDAHGAVSAVLALVGDTSERARLEAQLRQAQKLEAVGLLAAGVAHDFGNMLTAMFGNLELLRGALGGQTLDPRVGMPVEQIDRAAQRARLLTRQLLAFSRRQVIKPQVFELNQLLVDLDKMLRRLIPESVTIRLRRGGTPLYLRADPGQIEQVVLNLVVNARDAMPAGGTLVIETGAVEVDTAMLKDHAEMTPGPYVMLAVSDSGCGMDAITARRSFEPFFTTKPVGQGTGLGLATVQGIVRQAGGCILVYSQVGLGTTFRVYLPAVAEPRVLAPELRGGEDLPRGTETILVCEDDEAVREFTRRTLEGHGYHVLAVSDARAALDHVRKHAGRLDLLLTDVVMPHVNGRELVRQLAALRPAVRILYMSGYTANVIAEHGVLADGEELLQKPFVAQQLLQQVRRVLDEGDRAGAGETAERAARLAGRDQRAGTVGAE